MGALIVVAGIGSAPAATVGAATELSPDMRPVLVLQAPPGELMLVHHALRLPDRRPESLAQGALEIIDLLQKCLIEITGMDTITLQPAAGAPLRNFRSEAEQPSQALQQSSTGDVSDSTRL